MSEMMRETMNDKVYLVTGAAGFLGGTICRELLESGAYVRALVLPNDPARAYVPDSIDVVEGDICDMDSLHKHGPVSKQKCTVGIIITTQSFNTCIHPLVGTFAFLDVLRCCGCVSCIQFGGSFLQILYPLFVQIHKAPHGFHFRFSVRRI